jgi:hypothetical protein
MIKAVPKPRLVVQYPKPKRLLSRRPRMTFIAGFNCRDGIVLCADQLETDGVTRRYRCKLEGVEMNNAWAVSWGGSGDAHIIDKFTDKLKQALASLNEFDRTHIELAAETALTLVHQDYAGQIIQVIAGLWSKPITTRGRWTVAQRRLYRGRSDNQCMARETDYCLAGMDVTLAEFIMRNTFKGGQTTVDEAMRLGVFITALMKEYADGVGGDTDVMAYRIGGADWEGYTPAEVAAIEAEIPIEEVGRLVSDYLSAKLHKHSEPGGTKIAKHDNSEMYTMLEDDKCKALIIQILSQAKRDSLRQKISSIFARMARKIRALWASLLA